MCQCTVYTRTQANTARERESPVLIDGLFRISIALCMSTVIFNGRLLGSSEDLGGVYEGEIFRRDRAEGRGVIVMYVCCVYV